MSPLLTRLPLRWIFEAFYLSSHDPWQYFRSSFENERYEQALRLLTRRSNPPRRILEVGCSVGAFTRRLAALRPDELTAVDISRLALKRARTAIGAHADRTALCFARVDVFHGPLPAGPFDLIVAMDVLGYTDNMNVLRATRDRLLDTLDKDGVLLLGNTRLRAQDGEGFEPFASGFPRLGAGRILNCMCERTVRIDSFEATCYRLDMLAREGL